MPRSEFGPYGWPSTATKSRFASAGIDGHRGDLLSVAQTEMRPGRAAVDRFVDAVADRQIGALQTFAAPGVDDPRIARRDGERADRTGRFAIEDRRPRAAGILALPNSAVDGSDIEEVRLIRDAVERDGASAAHRTDETPVHRLIERRRDAALRSNARGTRACERDSDRHEGALQRRLPFRLRPPRFGWKAGPIFQVVLRGKRGVDVVATDRREVAAIVRARRIDAAVVASAARAHQEDALVGDVVADLAQPADVVAVGRRSLDHVSAHRLLVAHAEMIGDALHVGPAHEGLVPAATFRAAGRAGDVLRHLFEVLARELDDARDRSTNSGSSLYL